MSKTPNSLEPTAFLRAGMIGLGLAIFGIIAFVGLWLVLTDLDNAPRLFLSLCIPPLLIGLMVGGYKLATRNRST
jgi:hypothetical protein